MSSRHHLLAAVASFATAILLAGQPALAQDVRMLPLQREGQASLAIDELSRTAFIVDLGKSGDGNQVQVNGKPLLDYISSERKAENLVVACSHPHSDHMGGIEAIFHDAQKSFFLNGDLKTPRFKTITVIDDGVSNSLAKMYEAFAKSINEKTDIKFTRLSVSDPAGRPTNAFKGLAHLQQALTIENVPYSRKGKGGEHGRSVITLTKIKDGQVIADFDDADTTAIRSAVDKLKASGTQKIDVFVVPHHGSRHHDISPIMELKPSAAIIAVNPNNRFGHPTAPILVRLMKELGPQNVHFTGSIDSVVVDNSGIRSAHTAADRESYAAFVERPRARVAQQSASKARDQELAMFEEIRTMMFLRPPASFGGGPAPTSPGPITPGPDAPQGGGGTNKPLQARIDSRGSALPPGFDAVYVPPSGLPEDALAKNTPFGPVPPTDAERPIYVSVATEEGAKAPAVFTASPANTPVRYLAPTGLDSAVVPVSWSVPTAPASAKGVPLVKGGGPPNGGMVYLAGGNVTVAGNEANLAGATVDICGVRACLRTNDTTFELPFTDLDLFREVWHRVRAGVDAFYLSINPRKDYLRNPERFKDIPFGKMRFGTSPPTAGDGAMNEVVTSGGISRSVIGTILWDADVAFKSSALGLDVKTGVKSGAKASVLAPEMEDGNASLDLSINGENRWCRLYWTSGSPRLDLIPESKRIAFSGNAVLAQAEAMRLAMGELRPFPNGTWCQKEKLLAARLQKQANTMAGAKDLQRLRELSLMQTFAIWARARGISQTAAMNWAEPAASASVPTWTSGIRSEPVFQVQIEHTEKAGAKRHTLHMHFNDVGVYEECFSKPWGNVDTEWTALGLKKQGGTWLLAGDKDIAKLASWLEKFAIKTANCGKGEYLAKVSGDELEDLMATSGKSTLGPAIHVLSSQIHGGVLLGMLGRERHFPEAFEAESLIWSPTDALFLKRQGGELSMWSAPLLPNGSQPVAQRVVISEGTITRIEADKGMLRIAVATAADAVVRKESRILPTGSESAALEVLEAYHASSGEPILQKAVRRCTQQPNSDPPAGGCVQFADLPIREALAETYVNAGPQQAADMKSFGNGAWVIDLDMRHVKEAIARKWEAGDKADMNHAIATARLYQQWGFRREAVETLIQVMKESNPDSQDTILLARLLAGQANMGQDLQRFRQIAQELIQIEGQVESGPANADVIGARLVRLSDPFSKLALGNGTSLLDGASKLAAKVAARTQGPDLKEKLQTLSAKWKQARDINVAMRTGILVSSVPAE